MIGLSHRRRRENFGASKLPDLERVAAKLSPDVLVDRKVSGANLAAAASSSSSSPYDDDFVASVPNLEEEQHKLVVEVEEDAEQQQQHHHHHHARPGQHQQQHHQQQCRPGNSSPQSLQMGGSDEGNNARQSRSVGADSSERGPKTAKFLSFLEQFTLSTMFRIFGRFVGTYPFAFLISSLILASLSVGMYKLELRDRVRDGYTPSTSLSRYETDVLKEFLGSSVHDRATKTVVLRISANECHFITSALPFVLSVDRTRCVLHLLLEASSMRTIEKALIKRNVSSLYAQLKAAKTKGDRQFIQEAIRSVTGFRVAHIRI
uniref:Uncharacterized protein n=1 Tax=Globodera rostochiensis TaxID=31243 RepID=A0A914HT31_GLORO